MACSQSDTIELPACFEYIANCIQADKASMLYSQLMHTVNWQQPELLIFDKLHKIPRKQCFMGDAGLSYQYSKQTFFAQPWHNNVLQLANLLSKKLNTPFNVALLNYYRDGDDRMGWHADDEPELGNMPVIASVSLGATRKFKIRKNDTKKVIDIHLAHGSCLVMSDESQRDYQHSLPIQKKVKQGRINITFRYLRQ